jgi:prepilin-type N-terminal cleavage/methylation domain-containing protein
MRYTYQAVCEKKRMRGDKSGFTLAELLIVVTIVMILAAIAIPIFLGTLDKAYEAAAQATLRTAKSAAAAEYLTVDSAERSRINEESAHSQRPDKIGYIVTLDRDGNVLKIEYTPWYLDDTYLWQLTDWFKQADPEKETIEVTVHLSRSDLVY